MFISVKDGYEIADSAKVTLLWRDERLGNAKQLIEEKDNRLNHYLRTNVGKYSAVSVCQCQYLATGYY